jgi:hypothetical protein
MEDHSSNGRLLVTSGATFIALAEHLEEQFGADSRERQLVDDQQLDCVEVLLQHAQAAFVARFHEFMHEGGRGREGDAVALLAGSYPNPKAVRVLPVPDETAP